MKKSNFLYSLFLLFLLICVSHLSLAQSKEETAKFLDDLNRSIDRAVVKKDFASLEKFYGDDFVFTHGTGHVSSKESWIRDIQNMGDDRFASREHDSTTVEMHGDIGIISGKLSVLRESKKGN